jgi:hypothetical protein
VGDGLLMYPKIKNFVHLAPFIELSETAFQEEDRKFNLDKGLYMDRLRSKTGLSIYKEY